jgi:nucleotide-binding universal stress UspA family protein
MTKYFSRASKIFQDAGFAEATVSTQVGAVQKGIARDILSESKKGYDALLIGRGKSGTHKEMPLGSVASKLVNAVPSPAVWLIGSKPSAAKILLALDTSENSMRAVKHAGKMLQKSKSSITLFHAVRKLSVSIDGIEDIFPSSYQQRLLDEARQEIQPAFKLATLLLSKMGISPEQIDSKIVTGTSSRAATIQEEAERGGYGTIIVGRRGVSEVPDFSMGRVTNKLVQTAREQALWIVA